MILARVALLEYCRYYEIGWAVQNFASADRVRFYPGYGGVPPNPAYTCVNINISGLLQGGASGYVLIAIAIDPHAQNELESIVEAAIPIDPFHPTDAEYAVIASRIASDSSICKIDDVPAAIAAARTSRDELRRVVGLLNNAVSYHYLTHIEAAPFINNSQTLANDFKVLIAQLNALLP
jgi:hypothetical protein